MSKEREEFKMKLSDKYVLASVLDEGVLFPVGQAVENFNETIILNSSAQFLAELLQQDVSYDDILNAMIEKYEARPDEVYILKNDLDSFLYILEQHDALEK